jgi:hypothetical protein
MKRSIVILFVFISIYGRGQQPPTQVQAKRGVFTERLQVNGRWIDRISTDLNSGDSANDNVLATGKAIADFLRPRANRYIHNQFSAAQPASLWMQGKAAIGPAGYLDTLSAGLPAQVYVSYSNRNQGLAVQRSSNDKGPASLVFFKNNASDFNTLNALQPGDKIGSLSFSAHTGDVSKVANVMDITGLVEKTAPSYLSSGFVFNTTDTSGNYGQRMHLNAAGNLLLGNETTNPYKLNVSNGDVRFNSLAGSGDVLVTANNDGVLSKLQIGNYLYLYDGYLYASFPRPDPGMVYTALMSQSGQNDPGVNVLQNTTGTPVKWTRTAPGVYTGTAINGNLGSGQILKAEASDEAGNVFSVRISQVQSGPDTYQLIVKDNNLVNIDGWTNISIEIRGFIWN